MDLYVILGIDRKASLQEIKRAYRRLARRFHPDINPGDHAAARQFHLIAEAYATLGDPGRRQDYDRRGEAPAAAPSTFAFEGFDFSAASEGDRASTFGDLFADVLRAAAVGPPDARSGADLHGSIRIGFEEAYRGTTRDLTLTRLVACPGCRGAGSVSVSEARCPHCSGSGSVRGARGHMVFARPCPACGGDGTVRQRACAACRGDGLVVRADLVTVDIPCGIADGAQVRKAGLGHASRGGGRTGDLVLTVDVEPHQIFRRAGDDLVIDLPIAVHEAALGAKVEVPTLEGPARLKVPPGTQSGQRLRLRGRGMPAFGDDRRRGDLIAETRVIVPRLADERSKELMREFGQLNGDNVRKHLGV